MALSRVDSWVKTAMGPAVAGSSLYLCSQPANIGSVPPSPLVAIFQDAKGITPWPNNVAICDGFGHAALYAAPGLYTLVVVYGGLVQQVYTDQLVNELNSTGLPVTGDGSFVVSAQSGITTAPNGDLIVTDGSGNIQDSGIQLAALATTAQLAGLAPSNNTSLTGTTNIALANVVNLNSVLNAADFPGVDIGVKINNAIAALTGPAGDILIPAGNYLFSHTIVCPMGVNLVGVGLASSGLTWTLNTGCAIVFGGTSSASGSHRNFSLAYGGSGTNTSTGMYFGGDPTNVLSPSTNTYAYSTMRDVQVFGFQNNLRLGSNCFNNGWEGCIITSALNANVSIDPSVLNSGEDINFVGCYILGARSATGTTYAFYTPAGFSEVGMTWRLTNCAIDYHGINGAAGTTAPMQGGFKSVSCHFEQFSGVFFDTTNSGRVVDEGSYFVLTATSGTTEAFGIIGNATNNLFTGSYFWIAGGQTLTALINQPSTGQYTTVECIGTGVVPIYSPATVVSSQVLTVQGAALSGIALFTPTQTGQYRISWQAKVTRAATSSSTLGGATGFQIIYTDGFDSIAGTVQTIASTNSGNNTQNATSGECIINALAGSTVRYNFGYTSSGVTSMQYYIEINAERM